MGGPTPPCDAGRVWFSARPTRVLMPPVLVAPNSSGKGTGGIDARRLYANEIEEPGVSARVKRRAHARSASSPWRSSALSVSAAVEPEATARTGLAPQFGSESPCCPDLLVALATCGRRADFSRPCGARFTDQQTRPTSSGGAAQSATTRTTSSATRTSAWPPAP